MKSRRHVIPFASAKARGAPQHMRLCSRDPHTPAPPHPHVPAAVVQHPRMNCSVQLGWGGVGDIRHELFWHLSDHTLSTRRRANRVRQLQLLQNLARDISAGAEYLFSPVPYLPTPRHPAPHPTFNHANRDKKLKRKHTQTPLTLV